MSRPQRRRSVRLLAAMAVALATTGCDWIAGSVVEGAIQLAQEHPQAVRDLPNLPYRTAQAKGLNAHHIRQDVEDWVRSRGGSADQQSALMQAADALQQIMLIPASEDYVLMAASNWKNAQACMRQNLPTPQVYSAELEARTFDTAQRQRLRSRYFQLEKQFATAQAEAAREESTSPEPVVQLPVCTLDMERDAAAARAASEREVREQQDVRMGVSK